MRLVYEHLEPYLHSRLRSARSSVAVLAPFVRSSALSRAHDQLPSGARLTVVMRWNTGVFRAGASDPEVFTYCRDHEIVLLKHPTIHLKLFVIDDNELIAGSANLTDRALGVALVSNVEFMTQGLRMGPLDRDLVSRLHRESTVVSDRDYEEAVVAAAMVAEGAALREPTGPTYRAERVLLSQVPLTETVQDLWEVYRDRTALPESPEAHQLARFRVPPGLDEVGFSAVMRKEFLRLPLLRALTERLRAGDLYFGELKRWLMEACDDTADRDARSLTKPADTLLNWIEGLGEPRYTVVRPNYSERIRYETELKIYPLLRAPGVRPAAL